MGKKCALQVRLWDLHLSKCKSQNQAQETGNTGTWKAISSPQMTLPETQQAGTPAVQQSLWKRRER